MELHGWQGFFVIVSSIRMLAEVTPVGNFLKKCIVVTASAALSYYFHLDVLAPFGLRLDPTAWLAPQAQFFFNTTTIAYLTFLGHDAFDQIAGKE